MWWYRQKALESEHLDQLEREAMQLDRKLKEVDKAIERAKEAAGQVLHRDDNWVWRLDELLPTQDSANPGEQ